MGNRSILVVLTVLVLCVLVVLVMDYNRSPVDDLSGAVRETVEEIGDEVDDATTER